MHFMHTISNIKNYDYYPNKCQFDLDFNDNQYRSYVTFKLFDNKKMISWSKFLEKIISDFKEKADKFNHIAEMNTMTIANKMDMSNDFYIKHNICALERKLNARINENKNLINKLNRKWRHLLNRKIESYRVGLL